MSLFDPPVFADRELTDRAMWETRVIVPVSTFVTTRLGDPDYTVLALANGWVAAAPVGSPAAPPRFRIVDGIGYLDGQVRDGAGTIATLPSAARPAVNHIYPVWVNGGVGRVQVAATGNITLNGMSAGGSSSGNPGVGLAGISWVVGG